MVEFFQQVVGGIESGSMYALAAMGLVLIYQSIVYNTALRIMNDSQAADDLAQTAFISAWQHMDTFKGNSFKPWILRITINACYDELRRQRRHPAVPLEPVTPDGNEENEDACWLIDPAAHPKEVSEKKETLSMVLECLEALPEDYRTAMAMIDVQEMNYQETADILQKPLGTIKSRLLRARLRMRECLQGKGELFRGVQRTMDEE